MEVLERPEELLRLLWVPEELGTKPRPSCILHEYTELNILFNKEKEEILFEKKIDFFFIYVNVCVLCDCGPWRPERCVDPLEVELQGSVRRLMVVLGTNKALNYEA